MAVSSLALPNSGLSSSPCPPCRLEMHCSVPWLGVRSWSPVWGEGIRKRLRRRQGWPIWRSKAWTAISWCFPEEGGYENQRVILVPVAPHSFQACSWKIPASPYFWPHPVFIQPLDQSPHTFLLRPPPLRYLFLGSVDMGEWTSLTGHGWEVAGNLGSTWCCSLRSWEISDTLLNFCEHLPHQMKRKILPHVPGTFKSQHIKS